MRGKETADKKGFRWIVQLLHHKDTEVTEKNAISYGQFAKRVMPYLRRVTLKLSNRPRGLPLNLR
jgi:hypothetical protein